MRRILTYSAEKDVQAGLFGAKMDNDFTAKLEFSLGAREQFDIRLLKRVISKCIQVEKTDVETDKTGVDYIATLEGGAKIRIDAKAREKGASKYWKHGEVELALEIWSKCPNSCTNGKIGWTLSVKSDVDLILYTFDIADSDKYYLLPFQPLRMAFQKHGRNWVKEYGQKFQSSNGGEWKSSAVFVPAKTVIEAITETYCGTATL